MPRPKKPAGQAADPRNGARLELAVPAAVARPPLPDGLGDEGLRAWDDYWADPVCAAFTGADGELLREYVGAVSRRAAYQLRLDAEPLTEGSQGQLVVSPWAKLLDREDRLIVAARDRLGLSPLGRSKLGIALGEARRSLADLSAEAGAAAAGAPLPASTPVDSDESDDPRRR